MKSNICFSDSSFCLPTTFVMTFWSVQLSQHETRRNWKITNYDLQPICQDINPGVFISVGSWLHPKSILFCNKPLIVACWFQGMTSPAFFRTCSLVAWCWCSWAWPSPSQPPLGLQARRRWIWMELFGTWTFCTVSIPFNSTRQPRKSLEIPLFQASFCETGCLNCGFFCFLQLLEIEGSLPSAATIDIIDHLQTVAVRLSCLCIIFVGRPREFSGANISPHIHMPIRHMSTHA